MVNDETNLPVVLLGDWNTLPTDTLHQLLTQTSPLCPDKHDLPQLYPNLPLLPLCDIHLPKQQPGTHGEKETTTPGRPATHTGGQDDVRAADEVLERLDREAAEAAALLRGADDGTGAPDLLGDDMDDLLGPVSGGGGGSGGAYEDFGGDGDESPPEL